MRPQHPPQARAPGRDDRPRLRSPRAAGGHASPRPLRLFLLRSHLPSGPHALPRGGHWPHPALERRLQGLRVRPPRLGPPQGRRGGPVADGRGGEGASGAAARDPPRPPGGDADARRRRPHPPRGGARAARARVGGAAAERRDAQQGGFQHGARGGDGLAAAHPVAALRGGAASAGQEGFHRGRGDWGHGQVGESHPQGRA
mmetsp:Transcript_36194/g.88041  ORF Transcript_36194/g.88041 Transcript_36194/m.88041 type:complete len:201 (-) Transcript_36194:221-823(-)